MISLQQNERVIAKVRKHWVLLAVEAAGIAVLWLIPVIGYLFLAQSAPDTPTPSVAGIPLFDLSVFLHPSFMTFLFFFWTLWAWFLAVNAWTNFYLDIWIITSERLYSVEQQRLFHREMAVLTLDRIQDISVEVPGMFGMLIGFGNMVVETAGAKQQFKIQGIAHPNACKDLLIKAQEQYGNGKPSAALV